MTTRIPFPPPETSFVPGWAVGIPLLILVAVLVWWFLASMVEDADRQEEHDDGR